MRMTRAGYLADFYVYPVVAAALGISAMVPAPHHWSALGCAFVAGLAAWTLLEYVMHRWVFHRVPWIRNHHEEHHRDPWAFVGTPTWLSIAAFLCLVLLPSASMCGLATGSSFTAGLSMGYLAYAAAHYGAHYGHFAPGSPLSRFKRRHAMHHHCDIEGNFGVTTPFWDRVFGTALAAGHPRAR
jgi:sterol desaturase/sphingolipid hydroxylase (fatty acid hydroxylase superfamily)